MAFPITNALWQPISFSAAWVNTSTLRLDELLPSWEKRRSQLKDTSEDYRQFIEQLKRRHAIETGVIENLYDLDRGVTETFVRDGIAGAILQHDDTNIPPQLLLAHLRDHLEGVDFVFETVKHERPLSIHFIKELHQLLTRHQDNADGRDALGKLVKIPLLKGQFKQRPNNPVRPDGIQVLYAPPEQVDSEMDFLVAEYNAREEQHEHPARLAAWVHHAFTQIHPFQDGNGRIARLLASLILIRHNLFPFTVVRNQPNALNTKQIYIEALEAADIGNPQPLVTFFCDLQRDAIEEALNLKTVSVGQASFKQMAAILGQKVQQKQAEKQQQHDAHVAKQRMAVFRLCCDYLEDAEKTLREAVGGLTVVLSKVEPGDERDNYFYQQTVSYANLHNQRFNRFLPKGILSLQLILPDKRRYRLGVVVYHYGYGDATLAIGAFLEFVDVNKDIASPTKNQRKNLRDEVVSIIPLDLKPHTLAIDANMDAQRQGVTNYLDSVLTAVLAQIASDVDA